METAGLLAQGSGLRAQGTELRAGDRRQGAKAMERGGEGERERGREGERARGHWSEGARGRGGAGEGGRPNDDFFGLRFRCRGISSLRSLSSGFGPIAQSAERRAQSSGQNKNRKK